MRSYGQCLPAGPLNVGPVPFPVDPSLRHHVAPRPAVDPQTRKAAKTSHDATYTGVGSGRGGRVGDAERQSMRMAYADGESAAQIALRFGRARQTVYLIVKGARS